MLADCTNTAGSRTCSCADGTAGDGITCQVADDKQNNCGKTLDTKTCELWSNVPNYSGVGLKENYCTNLNSDRFWCFVSTNEILVAFDCAEHCNECNPSHATWNDNWQGDGWGTTCQEHSLIYTSDIFIFWEILFKNRKFV
mgnify:CR=1 FL=1